jgi:hypothetical protein
MWIPTRADADLDPARTGQPGRDGGRAHRQVLADRSLLPIETEHERQSAPYNLMVADDWMLVVPRGEQLFRGASINGLCAGSLFVEDGKQFQVIRSVTRSGSGSRHQSASSAFVARGSWQPRRLGPSQGQRAALSDVRVIAVSGPSCPCYRSPEEVLRRPLGCRP